MAGLNRFLLIVHFLGLAMGLSVPLANMVLRGMIAKATPPERVVLGGFPPLMSRLGRIGLAILWITGVTMVFTKYGGFAGLPWQFNAKLTAAVLLTVTVAYVARLERRAGQGDAGAHARIQSVGKFAPVFAVIAVIFAVLTFD